MGFKNIVQRHTSGEDGSQVDLIRLLSKRGEGVVLSHAEELVPQRGILTVIPIDSLDGVSRVSRKEMVLLN